MTSTTEIGTSTTATDVRREWGRLQRLARADAGVAYLGYGTGQLALHYETATDGIDRVFLKAVATAGVGDDPLIFYHAVAHRTDDERPTRREQFRHPVPALDWLHETVPDFDLVETVAVSSGDAAEESAPPDPDD